MLQFIVIGNLGADARIEESNGKKFVSFNVGHNDRWTAQDGTEHNTTQWVSCAIAGENEKLLPYLKKGRQVFVQGRGSARVFSSERERRMVAGLNIAVDRIELIGGSQDEVPRELLDGEGFIHKTYKAFYLAPDDVKALNIPTDGNATLTDKSQQTQFIVTSQGFIYPAKTEQNG